MGKHIPTYNNATRDRKSGKFVPVDEPNPMKTLSIRLAREIKDKYDTIPNRTEWARKILEDAIANYEAS